MFAAGCKKKVPRTAASAAAAARAVQPPAAPRRPLRPWRSSRQSPLRFSAASPSTLRWEVTGNVTSVSIDQGVGTVQNTGNRRVSPSDSTTYTLTATGPGGITTASATVNVSRAAASAAPAAAADAPVHALSSASASDVQDAYFDYDKTDIRSDARDALTRDAAALKAILNDFPNASIVVEGHCDERGSAEYNLGLGDRRASSAKEFLQALGVPADRLKTISYGKERPQCTEQNESCWQKNRRVHFVAGQ